MGRNFSPRMAGISSLSVRGQVLQRGVSCCCASCHTCLQSVSSCCTASCGSAGRGCLDTEPFLGCQAFLHLQMRNRKPPEPGNLSSNLSRNSCSRLLISCRSSSSAAALIQDCSSPIHWMRLKVMPFHCHMPWREFQTKLLQQAKCSQCSWSASTCSQAATICGSWLARSPGLVSHLQYNTPIHATCCAIHLQALAAPAVAHPAGIGGIRAFHLKTGGCPLPACLLATSPVCPNMLFSSASAPVQKPVYTSSKWPLSPLRSTSG